MRLLRTVFIVLISGILGAAVAAQRGGRGANIQAGQECPPGTTEVRPNSCQAPSEPAPSILDYRPKSTLVTAQHPVPKAKFPVIDIHSHQGQLTPDAMKRLVVRTLAGSKVAMMASALSRMNVEEEFFQAFQYRWNRNSLTALVEMFRQVTIAEPVIVRLAGSRRASME